MLHTPAPQKQATHNMQRASEKRYEGLVQWLKLWKTNKQTKNVQLVTVKTGSMQADHMLLLRFLIFCCYVLAALTGHIILFHTAKLKYLVQTSNDIFILSRIAFQTEKKNVLTDSCWFCALRDNQPFILSAVTMMQIIQSSIQFLKLY